MLRRATSSNIVGLHNIFSFGHRVAPCNTVLHDVASSLISVNLFMQHRPTFLLFSCLLHGVASVWTGNAQHVALAHAPLASRKFVSIETGFDSLGFVYINSQEGDNFEVENDSTESSKRNGAVS